MKCNGITTLKQNRDLFDTVGHAVIEAVPWLGVCHGGGLGLIPGQSA